MSTKITKTNLDWTNVKNLCRITMNKDSTAIPATESFKKKILIAEHSLINTLTISWLWKHMPSWVSVHFARHWLGWLKFISTARTDRTNVDRNKLPQDNPVNYAGEATAQALINVSRRRLCYQASPETRLYMEDLKTAILKVDKSISNVMVPNCIYRAGCPEIQICKYQFYVKFLKYVENNNLNINTIQQRYDAYNDYFYSWQRLKDTLEDCAKGGEMDEN